MPPVEMTPPPGMAEHVGLANAAAAPPPPGMSEHVSDEMNELKYGTVPQQAGAAVEGALRGVSGGLSDVAETGLNISTPEAIKGRMEANPWTSGLAQAGGAAALIAGTGGIAGPVEGVALGAEAVEAGAAAEAAASTAGMAPNVAAAMGKVAAVEKAGALRSLGATALGYGVEGAAFGGANVITDMALGDPDLNAQKITAELGMGALFGSGLGVVGKGIEGAVGKMGFIKGSLSDELAKIKHQDLTEQEVEKLLAAQYGLKGNIKEINEAAQLLGKDGKALPVTPGMASADPWKQQVEDTLARGAPTYAGIAKRAQFNEGYEGTRKALLGFLGEAESEGGLSKAQLGQALQQNITSRLEAENQPLSQLYNVIKGETSQIALNKKSLPKVLGNLRKLDEIRLDPNGASARLLKEMEGSIENAQSVDDIKSIRKVLSGKLQALPSRNERFIVGQIQDRLKDLEERTITRTAQKMVSSLNEKLATLDPSEHHIWADQIQQSKVLSQLVEAKKMADAEYKPFITKIKTLAEKLGNKNVEGVQSAIHFITERMTPEGVAQKLFSKGDSEFATWFSQQFPHEFELIKHYERAGLRDSSMVEGKFDTRKFLKKVYAPETMGGGGMAPERRNLLFAPDELKKMKAAEVYLGSFPKDFNPSHTSHGEATRAFFESPVGAAVANLRDFGMDRFLSAMTKVPMELRPPPQELGADLAQKFNNYSAAQKLIDKTDKAVRSGVKAIFSGGRGAILGGALPAAKNYTEKEQRIAEFSQNPEAFMHHVSNHIDGTTQGLPNISQSVSHAMTASAQFLESKRPKPSQEFALSPKWQPSEGQKAKFERYYDAVSNPVKVLDEIKRGQLTHESLEAIASTHPELFNQMRTEIEGAMNKEKAMKLSPAVKASLARFLGRPLNSSMVPQVIIANQAVFAPPAQQQAQGNEPRTRSTQSGLAKMKTSNRMRTETDRDLEPI